MARLTMEKALDRMYATKSVEMGKAYEPFMCYATLTGPVEMHIWNGTHPVEENTVKRVAHAGTRVLVNMASRFGDVGIRDDKLTPPSFGYYARVNPCTLRDWSTTPGRNWRARQRYEARK